MTRRTLLLASVALLLAFGRPVLATGERVEVFYLAAPDCPYCAHWESQSRAAFLASPEGKAVRFVEVRNETLRRPIEARHYPPEYQWVFQQIGPSRGVPRFLLAIGGKIVVSAYGTGGFQYKLLPALRQALDRRSQEKT